MYLGIDGQRLNGQRLGIGRYIEYMLYHWSTLQAPGDRIDLFLRGGGPHTVATLAGIRQVALTPALPGQLWQNLVLGRKVRRLDVLFCPAYTAPIARRGTYVVAIHSVDEVEPGTQPWHHRYTYDAIYRASARRARKVIAPSVTVSEAIQERYGVAADRITVVPLGVDECFRPNDAVDAQRSSRERLVGSSRPYLVFVGKLSRRRNIPLLLEAFATLVHEDRIPHALLLFGPNHLGLPIAQHAASLGVEDRVIQNDGRVAEHRDLVSVYTGADLFVSASSDEGTSLPMLEAMSCGTPVVAMPRGALPELAGDAALFASEVTAPALSDAMRHVLNDSELHRQLRLRGLAKVESYRWTEAARRTLEVVREAAAR